MPLTPRRCYCSPFCSNLRVVARLSHFRRCYQDLGGTQVLKSPCPDAFICHYCLGMNPLHCLDSVENAREAKKLDV